MYVRHTARERERAQSSYQNVNDILHPAALLRYKQILYCSCCVTRTYTACIHTTQYEELKLCFRPGFVRAHIWNVTLKISQNISGTKVVYECDHSARHKTISVQKCCETMTNKQTNKNTFKLTAHCVNPGIYYSLPRGLNSTTLKMVNCSSRDEH